MPLNKLNFNLNYLFPISIFLFISCGSFNSSSLVNSDGIYNNSSQSERPSNNSEYYENYFKDKSLELDFAFDQNENDIMGSDFITSKDISYNGNSASWGEIPNEKNYIIDNFYYRSRYFGYGYSYSPFSNFYYPYYFNNYRFHYPMFSMRGWLRYNWMFGFGPYFYQYRYGWWGNSMPYYSRNTNHMYGKYYSDLDYEKNSSSVSYSKGQRGSSTNIVVYGDGSKRNISRKVININQVRPTKENLSNVNPEDSGFRPYKDFVKEVNNSSSNERNRIYSRPESGSVKSNFESQNKQVSKQRRYYSNNIENSVSNQRESLKYNWTTGRKSSTQKDNYSVRSYKTPNSSTNSSRNNTYSSPSRNSYYSRPSSPTVNSSGSSGGSRSSSVSRGSR